MSFLLVLLALVVATTASPYATPIFFDAPARYVQPLNETRLVVGDVKCLRIHYPASYFECSLGADQCEATSPCPRLQTPLTWGNASWTLPLADILPFVSACGEF